MKIVIMSELFPPYSLGGGERQFNELAKHMAKKGHEVHVYTVKLPGAPKEETREGIHIHRLGLVSHPLDRRSLLPLPFFFLSLLFTRLPKDADVIHCNSFLPCIAGFLRAKKRNIPVSGVIHDIYRGTWGNALGHEILAPLGNFIEEIVCKLPYDAIVTVSNATKNSLMKTFDVPEERIHVCGSGIDLDIIDSVKDVKKKKNRVIYVGRLVSHKHVEDLIKAIGRLHEEVEDLECKIVGGGVLREELQDKTEKLGLGGVIELVGEIPEYSEVIKLMKSSEVLVLPSTSEGFGLVVLEAMRCKTVPVVYELPCYHDFSTESEVVFVPKRDVKALTDSIKELLENRKKLKQMAESGFHKAENYSWKAFSERVKEVFVEMISRRTK